MQDLRERIAKLICEMPYPCDQTGVADNDDLQHEAEASADAILELIKGAVKPLEWEEDCKWRYCGKPKEPIGRYCKWVAQGGNGEWYVAGQDGRFKALEAAKAAAQADYERRILAALGVE